MIGNTTTIWNGNLDELRDLVYRSWKHSYVEKAVFDYDKRFLEWFLEDPRTEPGWLFAQYDKGKLIAFVGCMKKQYRLGDRIFNGAFASFLSIDPEYTGSVYSFYLISVMLEKLKSEYKASGEPAFLCFYLDEPQGVYKLIKAIGNKTETVVQKIASMGLKIKVLDVEKAIQLEPLNFFERNLLKWKSGLGRVISDMSHLYRQYHPTDLKQCLALANGNFGHTVFIPYWDEASLSRQLYFPHLTQTIVYGQNDSVEGFLNFRVISLIGESCQHKAAIVDWVCDRQLTRKAQKQLVTAFLCKVKSQMCVMVMYPDSPHLDRSCLRWGGFLPYSRRLDLTCYNFSPHDVAIEGLNSAHELIL